MAFVNVELPDVVAEALKRLAAAEGRTVEAIAADALRDGLAVHLGAAQPEANGDHGFAAFAGDGAALRAYIAEGEADVAAGNVIPADAVFAELDDIIAGAFSQKAG